jgi:hypothetical protein
MQQYPTALQRKAPGRQNRFAFGARPQPLGNAVDKQVGDHVLAQVPLGKSLVVRPQRCLYPRRRLYGGVEGRQDLKDINYLQTGVKDMLDQLVWWTKAHKAARAQDALAAAA